MCKTVVKEITFKVMNVFCISLIYIFIHSSTHPPISSILITTLSILSNPTQKFTYLLPVYIAPKFSPPVVQRPTLTHSQSQPHHFPPPPSHPRFFPPKSPPPLAEPRRFGSRVSTNTLPLPRTLLIQGEAPDGKTLSKANL